MLSGVREYTRICNIYKNSTKRTKPLKYDISSRRKNAMILNPDLFKGELSDNMISKDELKRLLLMMTPGISKVVDKMSGKSKGLLVNTTV